MRLEYAQVDWPFKHAFRRANNVSTSASTIQVEVSDGNLVGRGEALGVRYHGETPASLLAQLESVKGTFERSSSVSREEVHAWLPAGGARNAIDCALWDLEAKASGRRAWQLAGIETVKPLTTAITLSVDSPDSMVEAARELDQHSLLKLKLEGDGDLERVQAVRRARPDVDLIVDANQAWSEAQLGEFVAPFHALGVSLIEQPLPVGRDDALIGYDGPIPLCADESCQTADSLPELVGKYRVINIKLDKTGGLTEALKMAALARELNLDLMVGCMGGSSLAMAPGFVVGQLCSFVDLDGPLLAARDVAHPIKYEGSLMLPPDPKLWG
jgi:L-alanine-DL-glutamate epimerase-like enolase superfamily enzyme